jgi:hypothetical protein
MVMVMVIKRNLMMEKLERTRMSTGRSFYMVMLILFHPMQYLQSIGGYQKKRKGNIAYQKKKKEG